MADAPKHPTAPAHHGKGPDDKAGPRKEYDELVKKWGDSLTPASTDPMDTRKVGPPLDEAEAKRLHELHGQI